MSREQRRAAVDRILDERLDRRLATAIVDRLGLKGDMDREQLVVRERRERDPHTARRLQEHSRQTAGAAVVEVTVDVELVRSPERPGCIA